MSLRDGLQQENGQMRGLTGSGRPGLHVLLGGTGEEQDASTLAMAGGSGQVAATARLLHGHRDVRLGQVAGASIYGGTAGGAGGRSGEAGTGRYQAK